MYQDEIEAHVVSIALSKSAQVQYAAGDVSQRELLPFVNQIKSISAAYVGHRSGASLTSPISSAQSAMAYALYYTPINAAKVLRLIPLLDLNKPRLRVLDLGSGPGTAALALLAASEIELDLSCVESSREMRGALEALVPSFPARGRLASLRTIDSLERINAGEPPFDLCIAANVFAELTEDRRLAMLRGIIPKLSPDGELLMIEPGQQAHTRALMQIRDLITTHYKDLTPLFPCTRSDSCPMLRESETDWCHDTIEWKQPRLNRLLDKMLGFNKHRIKYSAFLFKRGGQLLDGARVLTPPRKERAGTEALVCGKDSYGVVRIAKGLRSQNTRALEKAKVFERIVFSEPLAPGTITLGADCVIKLGT
ncbi:MAG: small ribosomal subunit Rsm22 family protein [Pseudomonadota bacterium]